MIAQSLCARCDYGKGINHRCQHDAYRASGTPTHWTRCKYFQALGTLRMIEGRIKRSCSALFQDSPSLPQSLTEDE